MFNVLDIMNGMKDIGHKITKEAFNYIPASLSKDKKFANAYACCVAMLVCADREIEVEETRAAINFIRSSKVLRDRECVAYALEFYAKFISEYQKVLDNEPAFMVYSAQLIEEHIRIVEDASHKALLVQLVSDLANVNANEAEIRVKVDILSAL